MDDAGDETSEACGRNGKHGRAEAPSTQDAELKPELLAQPLVNASREEQLKDLCQAVADLNPDRPWEDLLGRHKEFEELFTWVLRNPGGVVRKDA
ncbi:hypothetical protein ABBQ32_003369 [Trebouxia sp. C0010 RCD-2024]